MRKREILVYTVVWALVFLMVPITMGYHVAAGHDHGINFREVLLLWVQILPAFVLFVLHDTAAEYLLKAKHIIPYIAITIALVAVYAFACTRIRGVEPPPDALGPPQGPPPLTGAGGPPQGSYRPIRPEIIVFILGILLIGVNLGVKAFMKSLESARKLQQMQTESVTMQLESLRYQINPHFFMNTLNNIHALVDIDPEKAKESIEEFSKLMRYVLYDGKSPTIPLSKELEFLSHYVALMRLRFPENISISLSTPQSAEGAQVPPLVMASYVENAFKHGISYTSNSYINISIARENGKIIFRCSNSLSGSKEDYSHGVGQENVRARLDLLYGDAYTLSIEQHPDSYDILLILPENV